MYSLAIANLSACTIRLCERKVEEILEDDEFCFYHRHQNHFNYTVAIMITRISPYENWRNTIYHDEYGRKWVKDTIGVFFM